MLKLQSGQSRGIQGIMISQLKNSLPLIAIAVAQFSWNGNAQAQQLQLRQPNSGTNIQTHQAPQQQVQGLHNSTYPRHLVAPQPVLPAHQLGTPNQQVLRTESIQFPTPSTRSSMNLATQPAPINSKPYFNTSKLKTADIAAQPLPHQIASMPEESEDLEVIHRRSRLIQTRNNVVRTAVADPNVIEVVNFSPNEIGIIGLELGTTTLTLWFENNPNPLIYEISTIRDPEFNKQRRIDYGNLERELARLFPNSKVRLIPLTGKVIVKGQAHDSQEAANILNIVRGEIVNREGVNGNLYGPTLGQTNDLFAYQGQVLNTLDQASGYIVNQLEVPGEHQVMIRVTIAELNRRQLRRLGIDLNVIFNGGQHAIGYALGGIPSTLTGIFDNGNVIAFVNALAENGTAKILASPSLAVLSGHSASFVAGGEFAVPTIIGIQGAAGQQTTFRSYGTTLLVTPTLMDKDLIRMRIVPEFSQINQNTSVGGVPGLDTRRAQTTLQMREGQTIAIAGLFGYQSNVSISRIPLIGEIPIIGPHLFNTKNATQDQSELLILVTPEIIRPMDADEVAPVPGFEVTHPNDYELYHHAMSEGAPDTGYYQLAPYGRGAGHGVDVGYRLFNPAPANPLYSPVPTDPTGNMGAVPGVDPSGIQNSYPVPQMPGAQPTPNLQQTPTLQQPNNNYYQPGNQSLPQVPPVPDSQTLNESNQQNRSFFTGGKSLFRRVGNQDDGQDNKVKNSIFKIPGFGK